MLITRKSTPALAAAARSNGAKSRGPATACGKANTRLNALRHGLRSQNPLEHFSRLAIDPVEFDRILARIQYELNPQNTYEKALVKQIAINHCLNHVKKHSQQFVEVTEFTASVRPAIQHHLEHEEQREHFRRLVKRLPPKQKAILELRINEQLSYEEIAKISGRSVSTIKASVFFALEKLRKLVKDPTL